MIPVFFAPADEQGQGEVRGLQWHQVDEVVMQEAEFDECEMNSVQGGCVDLSAINLMESVA